MVFLFDGAIKKTTPAVVGFDISDCLHHVLRHPYTEFRDVFLKGINIRGNLFRFINPCYHSQAMLQCSSCFENCYCLAKQRHLNCTLEQKVEENFSCFIIIF